MTIFATWIDQDKRFKFSLDSGEHRITNNEHLNLLGVESTGGTIAPDPITGRPTATNKAPKTTAELLVEVHASQTQAIDRACEAAILAGFGSTALGSSFRYSSSIDDQLNLTGAILAESDSSFACRDEQGVKEFRFHTIAQLRQVGRDFTNFKLQLLQKANGYKQLLDQALDSSDLDALQAVSWESEQ
ncbi:hypothetical protein [Pseudomonas sp. 22 E 5]|nr:hypothetical protein [Pseudomonas sp. 22 E 5]